MSKKVANVFCLVDSNGKLLDPAVQATILAKYSRSPNSARDLLSQLTAEEADKFQEKWVVGYGHKSVAELASIPVCLEGVSIVASKFFESFQRAGYSEKSTRYQTFSKDSFVTPPGAPETMAKFASRFYETYDRLNDRMVKRCAALMGKDPSDPASLQDRTVKARAFDNLRYLLPAGTGTNLAIVANMCDFREIITKARGSSNSEFRYVGDEIHDAVKQLAPTLVKHTEPDGFEPPIKSLGSLSSKFDQEVPNWYVDIRDRNEGSNVINQNSLVQKKFESSVADLYGMSWSAFCKHMDSRPDHRTVPKVFRTVQIEFELMMDYGAFRDLQRHRRCEQFVEPLTLNYGYVVPDDIMGSDMEDEYRATMESIHNYEDENVVFDMDWIQYMIPLGYLHRSLFKMDLEQLYYISELRTKPQGHISYRRVAYEMYKLAAQKYPELMKWCRVCKPDEIGVHT